ncbi:MAG: homoaconitase [Longimicrobiales bacterium]|nr:homoaconitase [Longimicrobiales bacterium]
MGQTAVEKLAQVHLAEGPKRPLRTGDVISLRPRHIMTHDNTSAVMSKFAGIGATKIHDPSQLVFALDHDVQNTSEANLKKYASVEAFAKKHGVSFYPAGTGIGHQIMVTHGYALPGALVVASDSHSNMYGALGALGTPVVRTDAAAIWATGTFWWQIPRTVRVVLGGKLRPGVTGKDVIITLCGLYNEDEVLNAAVEFAGPGVSSLSMDSRLAIANMSTEWGALVGWFPVDKVTVAFLKARKKVLDALGVERFTDVDLESWAKSPPGPDPDAEYAGEIVLDLAQVTPHVSGPDTVQAMHSVADLQSKRVAIQKAYIIGCVNSRLEDLEAAARVVKGKKVAQGVSLYVAAASREVQQAAEASGAWDALIEAGALPLPSACGPCIGLGTGLLEPGEVGISATNRNFKGRMGSRDAQAYLASPEVVAASAVNGYISAPGPAPAGRPERRITARPASAPPAETVEILAGFPPSAVGRLVLVPRDNLNTDGIYGKDYTYKEGMTPADMARVVMENYDPEFAGRTKAGDILVGGFNFGTGSSREQAATALMAKGIRMVLAGSFSQTYLRNAYNNGFICIECPELVEWAREACRAEVERGDPTVIPGDELTLDYVHSTVTFRGRTFSFPALGSVPQSLVVAGGIENLVRTRLGSHSTLNA